MRALLWLLLLLLLRGTGLTTSLQLHHTAVSGLASGGFWPIECGVTLCHHLLDCVLERVRHEALPWLSAVAILGMW